LPSPKQSFSIMASRSSERSIAWRTRASWRAGTAISLRLIMKMARFAYFVRRTSWLNPATSSAWILLGGP
jgi:hypothetical protein